MNSIINSLIKLPRHKHLITTSSRYITKYNHIVSLENLVQNQLKVEKPDWESIRKEAINIDTDKITPSNVDYLILTQCNDDNTRKLAVDYVKYLESTGQGLNLATISKLLKMYGFIHRQNDQKTFNGIDLEAEIVKLYKNLMEKCKILDASLTESVIYALGTTNQWQECLNLIKTLQTYGEPTCLTYSAVIITLFHHGQEEMAWNYFQEMVDREKRHEDNIFLSFFEYLNENFSAPEEFAQKSETLFTFLSTNDIKISQNLANKMLELFKSKQKIAKITTINAKGSCSKCKTKLPETILTDNDFDQLKSAFFQRVIIGKDVFRKTTPKELASFKEFLNDKQHYDVIIDGLNVAYSSGVKKPVEASSGLVASVVEHYARQDKSILVLGRNHMRKWPHIARIKRYARLFLTQNLSQDDPYLLYCALNSGRGTIIVSRDQMRGHLYLLKEPHLKQLFKRWLWITRHQLFMQKKDGKIMINNPPCFILSAQKVENIWHLPILEEKADSEMQKGYFPPKIDPGLWLCLQL